MKCKKCNEHMRIEDLSEKDGMIVVIFICDECDLKCQGYYNPEHQTPDPVFWEDENTEEKKE